MFGSIRAYASIVVAFLQLDYSTELRFNMREAKGLVQFKHRVFLMVLCVDGFHLLCSRMPYGRTFKEY